MADAASRPTAATWPLAPGEHPDLPRLVLELHEGRPPTTGRKPTAGIAPYARVLIDTTRVILTSNPDRLRQEATRLQDLADALEAEHATHAHNTGQLPFGEER